VTRACVSLLEIKLLAEMSKRSLAGPARSLNRIAVIPTMMPRARDGQLEVKKTPTATPSVRVIRLCGMCKSVAVVVSTGFVKQAFDSIAVVEVMSSDECSCHCHALYARMKPR
jgi:hypothetical protein